MKSITLSINEINEGEEKRKEIKKKKKTHLKPTDSESSEKFKQAIEKPHLSTQ